MHPWILFHPAKKYAGIGLALQPHAHWFDGWQTVARRGISAQIPSNKQVLPFGSQVKKYLISDCKGSEWDLKKQDALISN